MVSTKEEILNHIKNETLELDVNNLSRFAATEISDVLAISRSLASQYLNELNKEGYIIKISSRPVLFFHKQILERKYGTAISQLDYYSLNELLSEIDVEHLNDDFEELVGANGSLKTIIDQCKASMSYPPFGLPILLYGLEGSGKQTISHAVYEYVLRHDLIKNKGAYRTIRIYSDLEQEQNFESLLFKENGLLSQTRNGVLYIENIHLLGKSSQILLADLINKREYSTSQGKVAVTTRFIFGTDEDPEFNLRKELLFVIPAIVKIPSFKARYNEEKETIILRFLREASLRINKDIYITSVILRVLANQTVEGELHGMKRLISLICANANAESHENKLYLYLYHFPKNISIQGSIRDMEDTDATVFKSIHDFKVADDADILTDFFTQIQECASPIKAMANDDDMEDIERYIQANIRSFYDYLLFEKKYDKSLLKSFEYSMSAILKSVSAHYAVNVPVNSLMILSRIVYSLQNNNVKEAKWHQKNTKDLSMILNKVELAYPEQAILVSVIENSILNFTGIRLDDIYKLVLIFDLHHYADEIISQKYMGVILAHGHTTASSIANTVNTLLDRYVYDAIDMPLDTTVDEIVEKLETHVNRSIVKSDLIVLVDMGSLEDIGRKLNIHMKRKIGVINNVSTRLALDVGTQILQGNEMKAILEKATKEAEVTYTVVNNQPNEHIIVFVSENGIGMANRMMNLFVTSLPKAINVEIVASDYEELHKLDENKRFKGKDILFVSGTSNPGIQGNLFINLEQMIDSDGFNIAYNTLKTYLTKEEIKRFCDNFVANFSMQNVMSHLTILEPIRLMEFVRNFVDELQLRLNNFVKKKTVVGLYIHISCMIERLVTKDPIYARENLDVFRIENKEFIAIVEKSFEKIAKHYGIAIPDSEISYLYDYISADVLHDKEQEDWSI